MNDSQNAVAADTEREPRTGSLVVVFLTVFIDLLGWGIVLPLLPIYAEQFAAADGIGQEYVGPLIGLLMASFSLMQFLFLPVWGRLSDLWGRRPMILLGLAGSVCFYVLFGWATIARSLVLLFVARIGAGIAGATISTAQAYIADTTSLDKRAGGMALLGAAFGLGFALGPLIGVVSLLAGGDLQLSPWPSYTAAGLSAAALVLAIFLLPESLRADSESAARPLLDWEGLRTALATPTLPALLLASFIAVFSFANFESSLARQLERIGGEQAAQPAEGSLVAALVAGVHWLGYERPEDVKMVIVFSSFAYLGFVLIVVQGFIVRRLAGIVSEVHLASAGSLIALVGFLTLALAASQDSLGWILIGMAIEVTGFAFVNPALQALISRRSDPAKQGSILGLSQSTLSLARILGPIVGNALFSLSPIYPYVVATAGMLLAAGMILFGLGGGRDFGEPGGDAPLLE